ncbi:lipoyl(octanoyl) transferase LipB [Frankia sp. CgMI4]|nr:lipoyl(octanoyl) transferase LipB [Frankia sp. CgIM4]
MNAVNPANAIDRVDAVDGVDSGPGPGPGPVTWPEILLRLDDDLVDYEVAMARMRVMVRERIDGVRPDTLWFLSHPPVYTVGKRTPPEHRPLAGLGIPVHETNRGGLLTYHAPGQLVGYVMCHIGAMNAVVPFLRLLEARLVDTVEALGIPAERRDTPPGSVELTGVWTRRTNRKIASIGLRCTRKVTSHGFALNVDCDMRPWTWATPCGMPEVEMTSVQRELTDAGHAVPSMAEVREIAAEMLGARNAPHPPAPNLSSGDLGTGTRAGRT